MSCACEGAVCACEDGASCMLFAADYPWCRSCAEHHRGPECAINEQGQALCSCGCPWDEVNDDRHGPACRWA